MGGIEDDGRGRWGWEKVGIEEGWRKRRWVMEDGGLGVGEGGKGGGVVGE